MGKTADRRLGVLSGYLPFLGTSTKTPTQVQQAFYRLGLHFSSSCQDDHFYLTLSGLEESFTEGVALLEELIRDAQPNVAALQNLVEDTLLRRVNARTDKRTVLGKAMVSYAKFGPSSPFTDKFTAEQLKNLQPEEITGLLRTLLEYKHEVFYFGSKTARSVANILKQHHPENAGTKALLPNKKFKEKGVGKDKVLFVHFPTVQVELLMLSKGTPKFSLDEFVFGEWYNQYFGYGLSSIVFQEIRESKALAYSAYVHASNPAHKAKAHWLQGYVGTQPDKLRDAVDAFQNILENMPVSLPQIETARQSVLKQIAAGRLSRAELYWIWRANRDKGFVNRDLREDTYKALQSAKASDLIDFQQKHVKGRHYTWLVLGDRQAVDFKYLRKIGKVTELTLDEVFVV
jgi:predicted Zn-dependent peptidase